MNCKRYFIGSLVVFVVLFALEFLVHAVIFKGMYSEHLELMRPQAESGSFAWAMILGFLILAFGFCFIFIKGYQGKGVAEGIRYGLYIGVTFSISTNLTTYAIFPLPGAWILAWCIYYPILSMILGAIFAAIYKPATAQ